IFRGALDVGATQINEEMKVACARALADLARKTSSAEAAMAYQGERMVFGREYLIPKPFDPRLLSTVASAVAQAAIDSGVAARPLDVAEYRERLDGNVFRTAMLMRPVFDAVGRSDRRVIFAEGEDMRVLRAIQSMIEEGIDNPILIGRPDVIRARIDRDGLPYRIDRDVQVIDPANDPRYREYWETYLDLTERDGVSPGLAQTVMRTNTTAIGAIAVRLGHADALICGVEGDYRWHLNYANKILGGLTDDRGGRLHPVGALSALILEQGPLFIGDSQVHLEPEAHHIAETCVAAARHIRRFGIEPKIALMSHSVYGTLKTGSGPVMREALRMLDEMGVDFEYDGEMHADHALNPKLRETVIRQSRLNGAANCLIFANVDAASGARNLLKQLASGIEIGPILMGMGNRVQIVSPSITARGLLNIAALARTPVSAYA
ncbi:MAG: NADP-dependent malic enzyme, partial [Rhodobacteraceae bacterium]|nr:NADP-dependent malic enzyme [Paracoccaceae bacterium]